MPVPRAEWMHGGVWERRDRMPVDGAGSCFVPTPAGRVGMMALIGGEDGGCEQDGRGEANVQ